jgi:dipeptidyl aminopeptidase/acylaminoacyl peptidase
MPNWLNKVALIMVAVHMFSSESINLISKGGTAFALGLAILLTGCGVGADREEQKAAAEEPPPPDPAATAPEAKPEQVFEDDGKLSCALAGADKFTRTCVLDKLSDENGKQMIFRHPDGGFRRFLVVTDGRGLVSADGADEASISILDDKIIEVAVNDDRYQLPAKIEE